VTTPLDEYSGRLHPRIAVLRHDKFRLLFFATLGSGLGTWIATIALTIDVQNRTHSTWWVSALLIASFLPTIVIGLSAGPLVDRLSRKRLIVGADLVRLAVFAVLPFVQTAEALVALAAVAGVANSFFRPAVLAGVPNLVDESELASGTSLLQATDWVAASVGPVLGGILVSAFSPHLAYWLNAVSFLFSALLLARIPARGLQSEQGLSRGHWRDLADGFGVFRRSAALRTVLFGFGLTMISAGLVNVAEVFLVRRSLGAGPFGYGLLWTATGIGLVIGSFITGSILEKREPIDVYPFAFLPWAVGVLGAGLAPNIWFAALAMVVAGIGNGLTFPITIVIVQRATPDRLRGRTFTVIMSVHNALQGLAMVGAALLVQEAGGRWAFVLAAGLTAAGGLVAYVLSRGLRREPALAGSGAT
jgi:MFS family permease